MLNEDKLISLIVFSPLDFVSKYLSDIKTFKPGKTTIFFLSDKGFEGTVVNRVWKIT